MSLDRSRPFAEVHGPGARYEQDGVLYDSSGVALGDQPEPAPDEPAPAEPPPPDTTEPEPLVPPALITPAVRVPEFGNPPSVDPESL